MTFQAWSAWVVVVLAACLSALVYREIRAERIWRERRIGRCPLHDVKLDQAGLCSACEQRKTLIVKGFKSLVGQAINEALDEREGKGKTER